MEYGIFKYRLIISQVGWFPAAFAEPIAPVNTNVTSVSEVEELEEGGGMNIYVSIKLFSK